MQQREGEKTLSSPRARLESMLVGSFKLQLLLVDYAQTLPTKECHELDLALVRALHVNQLSLPLIKRVITQYISTNSKYNY